VRFLCAALCAAFWATAAHAAELKEGKDWRNCSKDDQCVMIEGTCGKTAVNWQARGNAEAFYAQQRKTVTCTEPFWKPKTKEMLFRCRLGACETIPMQAANRESKT
jgi:hypothetical protein